MSGRTPGGKAERAWRWPNLHLVPRQGVVEPYGAILPLPINLHGVLLNIVTKYGNSFTFFYHLITWQIFIHTERHNSSTVVHTYTNTTHTYTNTTRTHIRKHHTHTHTQTPHKHTQTQTPNTLTNKHHTHWIIYVGPCKNQIFFIILTVWRSLANSFHCSYPEDRLCGLVVRVPGYRSRSPGSILGATRFSEK
jgi:hypothetical protein